MVNRTGRDLWLCSLDKGLSHSIPLGFKSPCMQEIYINLALIINL